MASSPRRWRISGNPGCDTPTKPWKMTVCCSSSSKSWPNAARRVRLVDARRRLEVVLRMLLLKHVRDWSYEVLSREVRANLVYREFTRIGGEKVPDDRTMGNLARQLGPEVIEKLHRRVVEIAQENKIAAGRKMRVDTTVVETDVHYPTDSSLLGDGVRVLTRIMRKVTGVAGKAGTQMRDRSRSAKLK